MIANFFPFCLPGLIDLGDEDKPVIRSRDANQPRSLHEFNELVSNSSTEFVFECLGRAHVAQAGWDLDFGCH